MKIGRRRFLLLGAGLGGAALLDGLLPGAPAARAQRWERAGWALGTRVRLVAVHEDELIARDALEAAFAELDRVEDLLSIYRPHSQLSRLNREGELEGPNADLVSVLEIAQQLSRQSGGAFDVTVQPLWELYAAATHEGELPDPSAIALARARVDYRRLSVAPGRIALGGTGMAVTLNGIAQGFALDRALTTLNAKGVDHALVDAGELGASGEREPGAPWRVAIQHPRRPDASLALASLDGRSLATSGDYASSFTYDHSAHHIFDPHTGRSPEDFSSVTVLAPSGVLADGLSTTVFVLGLERGLALVEATHGCDALFVLKSGRTVSTRGFPPVDSEGWRSA